MPLIIVRNDITKMAVDAIVNAANNSLLGGGGVDGAIHRAAGQELLTECKTLGGCETGKAKLTKGYNLPCRYVIHTVGPVYRDGNHGEKALLESCYRESLRLAKEHGCESIAFPLISSGAYGYPKDKALETAVEVIGTFLLDNEMEIYLVIFDKASYRIGEELFSEIAEYIDDHYAEEHLLERSERQNSPLALGTAPAPLKVSKSRSKGRAKAVQFNAREAELCDSINICGDALNLELNTKLKQLDESFSQMLLRKIDEKGLTDAACYKKANIDRKLFSKIRGDVHYKPSKATAIAFAISLELTLDETEDLLRKAGFALSHSNKFDIIIEYFIKKGIYNVFKINEALFAFDQNLLGA
ncbi:MAG: O-acetyl-ADP-ribose deacetylase [Clostridia bacterium]|nr:O-acetyl-ADP-ribose deacetylase [Clostridia bacterium]